MPCISGMTVLIEVTLPALGCTDHKAGISTKIERIEYEIPLRVIFMFKSAIGFAELRPEAYLKYRG